MYTHIFYYLKNMGYFTFTYQPQAVHLRHWVFTCFYPRVCWDGASHAHEAGVGAELWRLEKRGILVWLVGGNRLFGMLKVGLFQKLHFSVGKHDDQLWSFRLPHFQTNPNH